MWFGVGDVHTNYNLPLFQTTKFFRPEAASREPGGELVLPQGGKVTDLLENKGKQLL